MSTQISTLSFVAALTLALCGASACAVDAQRAADDADSDSQSDALARGEAVNPAGSGIVSINGNCSGVLVTNNWVLTAKHCHVMYFGGNLKMNVQVRTADKEIDHPNPKIDVSLVHLSHPMWMKGTWSTYKIPMRSTVLTDGELVTFYGYGPPVVGSSFGTLRKATLPVNDPISGDLEYMLPSSSNGPMLTGGDSGGPCFDPEGRLVGVNHSANPTLHINHVVSSQVIYAWVEANAR